MTTRQNLRINQGETWSWVYTYGGSSPVDLTGYTARMAVRDRFGGVLFAYLSTGADADGGTIALGDAAGTVTLAMTATESTGLLDSLPTFTFPDEMAEIVKPVVTLIYDLEIISGAGVVTRILEGEILVRRSVNG